MLGYRVLGVLLLLLMSCGSVSKAEDLGKYGQVFNIEERPFQEMIKERLVKIDIEKAKEEMIELVRKRVENPVSVSGVSRAIENRVFYFDPSYVLNDDVILPCGKILYKSGTSVNPLDHMDLERRIFFIDARDQEQVLWLKEILQESPQVNFAENIELANRVILVGGSVIDMSKDLGMAVYFDQHDGYLSKLWGIEKVPAIIIQEDNLLKIEEVKI